MCDERPLAFGQRVLQDDEDDFVIDDRAGLGRAAAGVFPRCV